MDWFGIIVRIALVFLFIIFTFFSCFFGIVGLIAAVATDTRYMWWIVLCLITGMASTFGMVYVMED